MRHSRSLGFTLGRAAEGLHHGAEWKELERRGCCEVREGTSGHQQIHGPEGSRGCGRAAEDEYGEDQEERPQAVGEGWGEGDGVVVIGM